jgi:PLP dependent protein
MIPEQNNHRITRMAGKLAEIRDRIGAAARRGGRQGDDVRLIAISKYAAEADLQAAYTAGQREFGESRIQTALPRIDALPTDVVWHMVGHLQGNKVNKVLGRFELIHSVDSMDLARRLGVKSLEREVVTQILVQVNCSGEESKSGLDPREAREFLLSLRDQRGIVVKGLMTMAPLAGGTEGARAAFRQLAAIRRELLDLDLPQLPLDHLSMGMSGDYEIAVEEGATLVRLGSVLFGSRQ